MKLKFSAALPAIFLTLFVLIVLDIFSTTLLPVLGLQNLKLNFNVLIILFLCFYLDSPYLPIFILIIQSFHSIFTIEGWAYGTLTGVLVSIVIGYLKDVVQFSGALTTILFTFLFQYLWFATLAGLLYFRMENVQILITRFWNFIPESIILSLCAPFIFSLLKKIWKSAARENNGEQVNV